MNLAEGIVGPHLTFLGGELTSWMHCIVRRVWASSAWHEREKSSSGMKMEKSNNLVAGYCFWLVYLLAEVENMDALQPFTLSLGACSPKKFLVILGFVRHILVHSEAYRASWEKAYHQHHHCLLSSGTRNNLHRLEPIASACTMHAHRADWSCDRFEATT